MNLRITPVRLAVTANVFHCFAQWFRADNGRRVYISRFYGSPQAAERAAQTWLRRTRGRYVER